MELGQQNDASHKPEKNKFDNNYNEAGISTLVDAITDLSAVFENNLQFDQM